MSFGAMAASYVVQHNTTRSPLVGSSVDANGTINHTCTFASATSGNLLIAIIAGAVTSSTPPGWNLLVSALNNTGLYVFTKTATSNENSLTTTHNAANYAIRGIVYEFPASTTVIGSNSEINASGGTISSPGLVGLTGTYTLFAARSHGLTTPSGMVQIGWSTPSLKDYEEYVGSSSNDGVGLSIASQQNMTASSVSCLYTMMWDNTASDTGESVIFALSM